MIWCANGADGQFPPFITVLNSVKRLIDSRERAFSVIEEGLHFNPNPSAIKGLAEPHGLQLVNVCGTVHTHTHAVGIFEHQFGLIRDPQMENNWRIKFSKLRLASEQTPSLLDSTTGHAIMPGPS